MAVSMKDRVVLVTGATQGIGLVTARELARMGASVSIVGRSAERTRAVAADIERASGQPVGVFLADLSQLAAVRQLAEQIREKIGKLHVLVNNAGAMHTTRKVTAEGLE